MSQSDRFPPEAGVGRNVVVVGAVVMAHAAALWAIQHGMGQPHPQELIVPAQVIAEFIASPAPEPTPAPPTPPKPTPPVPPPPKPAPKPKPVVTKAPPLPKAIRDPAPAPDAPRGTLDTAPVPAEQAPPAPVSPPTPPAPPAPPAAPRIEQPSSNAAYLNNPAPPYPSMSKRMGEQGKVLLRVYVNEQGLPEKIEIKQSSGYERLDEAAIATVQRWKFVPGKRNGVPEAMWNIVPINFVLR